MERAEEGLAVNAVCRQLYDFVVGMDTNVSWNPSELGVMISMIDRLFERRVLLKVRYREAPPPGGDLLGTAILLLGVGNQIGMASHSSSTSEDRGVLWGQADGLFTAVYDYLLRIAAIRVHPGQVHWRYVRR